MRLVLFRDQRTVDDVIQITLEHVSSSLMASHTCYSDGSHGEHEGEAAIHRVTDAHLIAIYDAIGCALGKDVPEPKDEVPAPFRVERKDDGLWLRVEGYNRRQAAIRLADSHGPIVTAAIEEAIARQEQPR